MNWPSSYWPTLLSTATGCSHRRVLPSRSTGAGELIQFTGRRIRCTADAAALARVGAFGDDAVVLVLAAIAVVPSVARYPPRGGSCQPSSTTGCKRQASSQVITTEPSRATGT